MSYRKRAGRFARWLYIKSKAYAPFVARALLKRYTGITPAELKKMKEKTDRYWEVLQERKK